MDARLVEAIDNVLPQTQCRQCGFDGCRPYAEAIVCGRADINQCPPGGQRGINALAALMARSGKALNTNHGKEKPRALAWIDEAVCIGCTKCIQACPVDAIVGAAKSMHTVLLDHCTGCELCVAPCPVDCIHMLATMDDIESRLQSAEEKTIHALYSAKLVDQQNERYQRLQAPLSRSRHHARNKRLAKSKAQEQYRGAELPVPPPMPAQSSLPPLIQAAIARANEKRKRLAEKSTDPTHSKNDPV